MSDREPRLGDVIDDYCPRCRLLLNHDVASLAGATIAKATCRTCHNTHDYRNGQAPPPRKKTRGKEAQALLDQVLATMPGPPAAPTPVVPVRKKRDLWGDLERIKQKKD